MARHRSHFCCGSCPACVNRHTHIRRNDMSNALEPAVRSPSYPVWSLSDAVTAVGKIEAQYRMSKVDREVAAKIIGYSGLSGPANKALAALGQYGLVERAGKGEM